MMLYANGFLPYHVDILVETGAVSMVHATLDSWKREVRSAQTFPGFPEALIERLENLPGVRRVDDDGPHSSMLIALRMAQATSAAPATFSAVLGTGPIARAIERRLEAAGVKLQISRRLLEADSPIELSVRDVTGAHEGLILYPALRRRYVCAVPRLPEPPDTLLCNRHNKGLAALARAAHVRGALVSHRPHQLGQHDRIEEHLALLPALDQLVLSSRSGVLGRFARALGLEPPRGWPAARNVALRDAFLDAMARRLLERMPPSATLLCTRHHDNGTVFYRRDETPLAIAAPEGFDRASRAARLQGALLGRTLGARLRPTPGPTSSSWDTLCHDVVRDAFAGTEARPWSYARSPVGRVRTAPGG